MSKWNWNNDKVQENMSLGRKLTQGRGGGRSVSKEGINQYLKDKINKTEGNDIANLGSNRNFQDLLSTSSPEHRKELNDLMKDKEKEYLRYTINKTEGNNIAKLRMDPGFIRIENLSPEYKKEINDLMENKEKEYLRDMINKTEGIDIAKLRMDPGFIRIENLSLEYKKEINDLIENKEKEYTRSLPFPPSAQAPEPGPPPVPLFDMRGLGDNNTNYLKLKYYEVLQTISKMSLSIDVYEKSIAESLVNAMSGKNHTNNDVILVKKNFASFLSLLASCYVVYNWFFVMYFINEDGERVKTIELSLTKMKQNNPIFHFFFKHTLCVLSMMDKFILDIVPSTVSGLITDRRLQFISLFVSIYLIINVFGSVILNSIDSTVIISVYVGIFVLYELYCVLCDFLPDENGSTDITRMQKYMIFGSFTPLMYLMLFFMRLVWSIVLIGVTSFVNCAYILLMSFVAIPIYSSSSFFKTFKILNEYIWKSKKSGGGLIELSINIFYRFLYEISFILILLLGVFDYSSNMSKMSQMPTIISCLCYVFIFLFAFIAYQRYLINGSLSAYIDKPEPVMPSQETIVQSEPVMSSQKTIVKPDVVSSHNDKFNFLENKLIDTKSSMADDATNMAKKELVDTMMKTVKNSKYGKMIPSKLLSSLV